LCAVRQRWVDLGFWISSVRAQNEFCDGVRWHKRDITGLGGYTWEQSARRAVGSSRCWGVWCWRFARTQRQQLYYGGMAVSVDGGQDGLAMGCWMFYSATQDQFSLCKGSMSSCVCGVRLLLEWTGRATALCKPAAGHHKAIWGFCFLAVLALIGQDPTESEQGRLRTTLGAAGDKRRKSCTGAWRFCDRGAHWRGWWAASW
jgi:hypothetical protein